MSIRTRLYFFLTPYIKQIRRSLNPLSIKRRITFQKSISDLGIILEIGPFNNPFCKGENVKYFDILTQSELVNRAIRHNLSPLTIPFIDYVSPKGDLSIINKKFNSVFSSHVIEHQPNLVKHLQQVENLLENGGCYYLFIPDKRFCFDYYNQETGIAEILDSFYRNKKKHSLKSLIEHRAFITHINPIKHWRGNHGKISDNHIQKIRNAITENNNSNDLDVHAWYFTPDSFQNIILTLNKLNLINFVIRELNKTQKNSLEFFVTLQKPV